MTENERNERIRRVKERLKKERLELIERKRKRDNLVLGSFACWGIILILLFLFEKFQLNNTILASIPLVLYITSLVLILIAAIKYR